MKKILPITSPILAVCLAATTHATPVEHHHATKPHSASQTTHNNGKNAVKNAASSRKNKNKSDSYAEE